MYFALGEAKGGRFSGRKGGKPINFSDKHVVQNDITNVRHQKYYLLNF